ncbi:zinc finger protein 185 isoform X2 [Macrotis lagotis]|uniref:zinc finger protein 185 isoform X2 n=1 Tax=Macrotis lagotis TaxID=92651 RepID=UPI003D68A197
MMPFRKPSRGQPQSGEDGRTNAIKKPKIRATIKSDKSWIQKPNEKESQSVDFHTKKECPSVPPSDLHMIQQSKPPASKSSSGYIIRGIFTKPVDSATPKTQKSVTFGSSKRSNIPKRVTINLPQHSAPSYKTSPDDYKRTTEASRSVLQKSTTWGHSYVLSAVKKTPESTPKRSSLYPPSRNSAPDLTLPFRLSRVNEEDEDSSERSQMTPIPKYVIGINRSVSGKEKARYPEWARNESVSVFSSPRHQEMSEKRRETHTAPSCDSKVATALLDLSLENKTKRSGLSNREKFISNNQEGFYEGFNKQKHVKPKEPSSFPVYEEAGWKNTKYAGAKGGTHSDANVRYNTPDAAKQLALSSQETGPKRCVSAFGETKSTHDMIDNSQESASVLDNNQRTKSIIKNDICTYCYKAIISGPKIILEHLNICCHEHCFKCGVCNRAMGTMLNQVYIHNGIVHCVQCYSRLF